jgi:hypothetical protein
MFFLIRNVFYYANLGRNRYAVEKGVDIFLPNVAARRGNVGLEAGTASRFVARQSLALYLSDRSTGCGQAPK